MKSLITYSHHQQKHTRLVMLADSSSSSLDSRDETAQSHFVQSFCNKGIKANNREIEQRQSSGADRDYREIKLQIQKIERLLEQRQSLNQSKPNFNLPLDQLTHSQMQESFLQNNKQLEQTPQLFDKSFELQQQLYIEQNQRPSQQSYISHASDSGKGVLSRSPSNKNLHKNQHRQQPVGFTTPTRVAHSPHQQEEPRRRLQTAKQSTFSRRRSQQPNADHLQRASKLAAIRMNMTPTPGHSRAFAQILQSYDWRKSAPMYRQKLLKNTKYEWLMK